MPLWALMVMEKVPPVPAAGVPASVAVPLPLSLKVTPDGSAPVSVKLGAGKPVVVTEKVPAEPTVKVVALTLLMAGALPTIKVKFWLAGVPTPLVAVMVMGKEPVVLVVPERVAVPLPLSTNVIPVGSAPDSARAAVGIAVVVTEKVPEVPATNEVVLALVMVGCSLTVMLKLFEEVCGAPVLESLTWTVKVDVPVAVGVPVMAPDELLMLRPGGRVPTVTE